MDTIIVGGGGHGRVVLDTLRIGGKYTPVGFIDADPTLTGTRIAGVRVLGAINALPKIRQQQKIKYAIVAIGDNHSRASYAKVLRDHGFELTTAIHPQAIISPTATVGANCFVAAGAIVGTDAKIGESCIINTGAIVEHECVVEPGAHLCPGSLLAGRVRIGAGAFVGLGAKVIQCLSVGQSSTVGAGAVVIRDVPDFATVVGVPARVIKIAQQNAA